MGHAPAHERLSETGRLRRALGMAWAGYYADRALLLFTFPWLLIRVRNRAALVRQPEVAYEPEPWLGRLLFPDYLPGDIVWFGLLALAALAALACLLRPRLLAARIVLALGVMVVLVPEFSWKVDHMNHLFLLAHLYAVALPVARPVADASVYPQAQAVRWYHTGLLLPYTAAGLWKFVDMTIRRVLKPGMSWLDPDAMVVTSIANHRSYDLPLSSARVLDAIAPLIPMGYVGLAFVFSAAIFAAWRRPLIALILPTILVFHLSNVFTLYVRFLSTCVVALVLFLPYDRLLPSLRRTLRPATTAFDGHGAAAHYRRRYVNGDEDAFAGFFAYRARLADRSWLLAAPLYYPGVAWLAARLMKRTTQRQPST